jgi:hypothetical protein
MRYQPRTKPFPHQSRATLAAVRARNFALFLEPRLGKSKAALDYVGVLALKGEVQRVLVVFPAIARDVWEDQIQRHYPYVCQVEDFERRWHISREIPPGGVMPQWTTTQFFLASREEVFRATRTPKGGLVRPKQKLLEAFSPDVIVFDESHEYKRPGGRSSQDAWRMVRRLRAQSPDNKPYVLLLSGTPNPKGWRDLFAQFRIMDDTILGTNASDFDEEYVVYGQGSRKYTIVKYNNVPQLEAIVRQHSLSLSAEAVGMAGVVTWQALKTDLPSKARDLYTRLATDLVVEVEDEEIEAVNAGVLRLRLRQITGGYTTKGTRLHTAKTTTLESYLKLLRGQQQHVLVYCNFSPEVAACADVCERVGYQTRVVEGATSKSDRAEAIQPPASSSPGKAVVFQIQAGSRAIDLSWAAELVFYSVPDGWVDYFQALNRVRGPNQKRPVRITHLVARATLDVADIGRLRRKEDAHATMMRNPKRYLGLI